MRKIRWERRRMFRIAMTLLFLVGVPVALLATRGTSGSSQADRKSNVRKGNVKPPREKHGRAVVKVKPGVALSAIDSALSKTIEAGNYDMTFGFGPVGNPYETFGNGLADLDPQALSVNVHPRCIGRATVRIDGSHAWLIIGGMSDPAGPPSSAGQTWPTYDLVGFQRTSNTCFGPRLGALATLEMASPEGMLALSQQAISTATPVGTVTVNGAPATEYEVGIDPAGLLEQPASTVSENQAIELALNEIGDAKMTATIAVDAAGYIVEMVISVAYPDITETHTVVLSNFGSAGTVELPPVTAEPRRGAGPCRASICPPPGPTSPPPGAGHGGGGAHNR